MWSTVTYNRVDRSRRRRWKVLVDWSKKELGEFIGSRRRPWDSLVDWSKKELGELIGSRDQLRELTHSVVSLLPFDVLCIILKFLNFRERAHWFYSETLCMYAQQLNERYDSSLVKTLLESVTTSNCLSNAQRLGQIEVWCQGDVDLCLDFFCSLSLLQKRKSKKLANYDGKDCTCYQGNRSLFGYAMILSEHIEEVQSETLENPWFIPYDPNSEADHIDSLEHDIDLSEVSTGCELIRFLVRLYDQLGSTEYVCYHFYSYTRISGRKNQKECLCCLRRIICGLEARHEVNFMHDEAVISRVKVLCEHLALRNGIYEIEGFEEPPDPTDSYRWPDRYVFDYDHKQLILHGLLLLATRANSKVLVNILLNAGAGQYESTCTTSALLTATELGHHEVLRQLLNAGVNPNCIWIGAKYGCTTPLQAARRNRDHVCINLLRNYGAVDAQTLKDPTVEIIHKYIESCDPSYGYTYIDIVNICSVFDEKKIYNSVDRKKVVIIDTTGEFSEQCSEEQYSENEGESLRQIQDQLLIQKSFPSRRNTNERCSKRRSKSYKCSKGKAKSGGRRLGYHYNFYRNQIQSVDCF